MERRTSDIFDAGYGALWVPPPGRADSGNFSVGYDPYDRFDLGGPDRPTLYGTRTGISTLAKGLDKAGVSFHVDTVLNHAGFSDLGTTGFAAAGGYPGLAITLGNSIDGDFHSSFESGDLKGRLSGLVDLNHSTNHQLIRNPVDPANPHNIPSGVTPAFGRLANVPTNSNRQFYPDRDSQPMYLFDPATGESGIAVYPYNLNDPNSGDPVRENALGYLMRYMQWMVQEVGVDGFRVDAAKHFDQWVLNYLDRAVYRSNPRTLLDGSVQHVFSYSEVFDGNRDYLQSFVRKDINNADPGRIGGNRDVLDFSSAIAMHDNLNNAGTTNAWLNIRNSLMDLRDDGIHNGSQGVLFVNSHDERGPSALNNVAHAFALLYPGNAVVYMNGKEFGDGRDFPKDGRGDALGGVYGDTIRRLVQIRNTHGRGNFIQRYIANDGLYVYERESSIVVGLSNRGDNGFDERTIQVAFAPGTHLIELTGNASNPAIDPFNDIPEVVTVSSQGTINVRVPRNRNANGLFHGTGYVMYGLATPQSQSGIELTGVSSILPGSIPSSNNFANGTTRLNDWHVITGDSFDVRLRTNEVRLLGLESLRDVYADGDAALLKLDGGTDINGNGTVDFVTPGNTAYGFERFVTKNSPLIGSSGVNGPRGDGEFKQTISSASLSEGQHYLTVRAFRHRTDGGPAVFTDLRDTIYVDRLRPESGIESFAPWQVGVNENRDLVVRSLDKTANAVHAFLNLPAGMTDSQILAMANGGQGTARQIDRDQFIFGFSNIPHGNNVVTIVSYEPTGNYNVQRIPGQFFSTIVGAGLGDVDFDGDIDGFDKRQMQSLVASGNTTFNAAGDFDADGSLTSTDLTLFVEKFIDQLRGQVDFGDAPLSTVVPTIGITGQTLRTGPAHVIDGLLRLGNLIDAETTLQSSENALGDDSLGADDEDGISYTGILNPGFNWSFSVDSTGAGKLDAWIDFNRNGLFEDVAEHLGYGVSLSVVAGTNSLSVQVPSSAVSGIVASRFRISSAGNLRPNDYAIDGEVEDMMLTINSAPTDITLNPNIVLENTTTTADVLFGQLITMDMDPMDSFVYELVPGTGDFDNAKFIILDDKVFIKQGEVIDFEAKASYSVRVQSTDAGGFAISQVMILNVTDVNEAVVLTRTNATVTGDIQTNLNNSGTWVDPESNNTSVVLTASLGAVVKNSNGTWAWSYSPPDVVTNQTVTITANDGTNSSSVTFTINAVAVTPTLTITSGNRTYDRTAYSATATLSGSANPTPAITFAYFSDSAGTVSIAAPINAGTYYVRASVATNSNNNAAQSALTAFTIERAPLIANVTVNNKPFDNTTAATIASRLLSGVIGPDVVTLTGGSATFADIGVGNNKTVNITGLVLGGADVGNYTANSTATALANITSTVFNRQVFYKGSSFAGANSSNPNVPDALDTVKVIAQSGTTAQTLTFANVVNTSRGINGLVFDVAGLLGSNLSASDFGFRMSPTGAFSESANPPNDWSAAPAPSLITVTAGSATAPARVRIEWGDGLIANRWLQVRVLATTNTGLPSQQTFYIGHLQGEVNGIAVGGASGALQVTNADIGVVRPLIGTNATVTSTVDITKNGLVQNSDITAIRSGVGVRQLRLITIPVAGSGGEGTGNGGGSGNGTGGGNGDGDSAGDSNNGVSDKSSLDAFAMMAPLADMGSKTDTTNATKSIDPTATSASSLLTASSNRTNLDGSFHRIASKQFTDSGTEKAVRITTTKNSLNVRWSDDFFASFDDREIR
jgi:glycosidase